MQHMFDTILYMFDNILYMFDNTLYMFDKTLYMFDHWANPLVYLLIVVKSSILQNLPNQIFVTQMSSSYFRRARRRKFGSRRSKCFRNRRWTSRDQYFKTDFAVT